MKVLFAIGNPQTSKAVAEQYSQLFNEELDYKDVFYFKALLEEVKRDKEYDRIVISEELEQTASTSIEDIDRYVFNNIDKITDEIEASKSKIILICSDRRVRSDSLLSKLYGNGIYSMLLGDDRSVMNLCNVIKKPRTKKEAKEYLRIDYNSSVTVNSDGGDDEVSEDELVNIIKYYDRLGDDTSKYIYNFDKIAEQYNTKQLKVIAAMLPQRVKDVLSASDKYGYLYIGLDTTISGPKPAEKVTLLGRLRKGFSSKEEENKKREEKRLIAEQQKKEEEEAEKEKQEELKRAREAEKQKRLEEQRLEAEKMKKEAEARRAEEARIKEEERAKEQAAAEERRKQEELEREKRRQEEEARRQAEAARKQAEEEKQKAEQEAKNNPEVDVIGIVGEAEETAKKQAEAEKLKAEEEARRRVEEERQKAEEEARRKADEERRIKEELEAKQKAEEERIKAEMEAKRKAEEDRIKAELEAKKKAEEERLKAEMEAKKQEAEKLAMAATQSTEEYTNFKRTVYEVPKDYKKVIALVGPNKSGTTFIANAVANNISEKQINTALLDMTKDKGLYYIYNKDDARLRKIALECMRKLSEGVDTSISASKFLHVYTSIPGTLEENRKNYKHKTLLETVKKSNNLILVDCDFTTPFEYFEQASEIYIVQDLDILKLQETTMFLRELKSKNVDMSKVRVVINKYVKTVLTPKKLVEGLSYYNDPEMSFVDELLSGKVIYSLVPFRIENYANYVEGLYKNNINYNAYTQDFRDAIEQLCGQIYPVNSAPVQRRRGLFG